MSHSDSPTEEDQPQEIVEIDLRDPRVAAFLGWLIPGAGHFYQKRLAKGILFFVCILGTFLFGLYLGNGHSVFFQRKPLRLHYLCQVGAGLVALPALVQAQRMAPARTPKAPLWNGLMAPPISPGQVVPASSLPEKYKKYAETIAGDNKYVVIRTTGRDDFYELSEWTSEPYFDMGVVFTMIAGLLNLLAVYDAYSGPLWILPAAKKEKKTKQKPSGRPGEEGEKEQSLARREQA